MRLTVVSAIACLFATTAVALADNGNRQKIRFNAADQATARAAVLRRSDLGSGADWKGGAKKPDLTKTDPCPNYNPKQSDLVLTGIAETQFTQGILAFDSEVKVLETPRMVQLDWRRSVLAPGVLPCLRSTTTKALPAGATVVSVKRILFPHVAPYTAAFRLITDVHAPSATVRLFVDLVLFGSGRTESSLTTTAPYSARVRVKAAEIRLAKILAARVRV
jgi:hypothetical protein